jgi:uncharacterized membrane protein
MFAHQAIVLTIAAVQPQLFTAQSLGTFAGASSAVMILTNVFARLVGRAPPAVIALAIAMLVAFLGAYGLGQLTGVVDIWLAVLNGCLLFSSAVGIQETVSRGGSGGTVPPPAAPGAGPWKLQSWFGR